MTQPLRALVDDAAAALARAGIDTPRVDAELLLADALGVARSALLTRDEVPTRVARRFFEAVARRAAREPLQHITGRAAFRYVELAVGPGVFVPRPETELLVDAVLPHLRAVTTPNVVDLCAGSGALAVAIAREVPAARVCAVESSPMALRWLRRNTADTGVRILAGDLRHPELLAGLTGRADVVVCNPPYVPSGTEVSPEVRADPREAVFAGSDGLDLMSTVISSAAELLRAEGLFAVEHDDSHGEAVPALFTLDGHWSKVTAHRDLAGRPRYVLATRG